MKNDEREDRRQDKGQCGGDVLGLLDVPVEKLLKRVPREPRGRIERRDDEPFGDFCNRIGVDALT